jgi:hypothetical protein
VDGDHAGERLRSSREGVHHRGRLGEGLEEGGVHQAVVVGRAGYVRRWR